MSGNSGLGSKLLKKMGWTEGTAIGKSGTGIVLPIKPKLKIGTAGIGFRESERLCSGWWMDAFNKAAAASASEARSDDDDNAEQQLPQSSSSGKRRRHLQQQHQLDSQPVPLPVLGRPYAAFAACNGGAAGTVLRNGREETVEAAADDGSRHSASAGLLQTPSDEDLLAACSGRTAHAAARFGLNLGGKLARIRAQDLRLNATEPTEFPPAGEVAAAVEEEVYNVQQREKKRRKRRRRERTTEDSQGGGIAEADNS